MDIVECICGWGAPDVVRTDDVRWEVGCAHTCQRSVTSPNLGEAVMVWNLWMGPLNDT